MKSDFGAGLSYNLGLFLAHAERKLISGDKEIDIQVFFNGAGDHLFDLEIPNKIKGELRARLKRFQNKVLKWRLGNPTEKDKEWAISEAKNLLRLIDKFNGVFTIKGDWE